MHRVHRLYITNALHISSLQTIQLVPFPGVLYYVDQARSQIVKFKRGGGGGWGEGGGGGGGGGGGPDTPDSPPPSRSAHVDYMYKSAD